MADRVSQEFPFFQVSNTVIDIFGPKIGPYGIAVYSALAYHANQDGGCFPSLSKIATETGMCRRKVISTVGKLEALGLIEVTQRHSSRGDHTSNHYFLPQLDPAGALDKVLGSVLDAPPLT